LDSRINNDLQEVSLPVPLRKLVRNKDDDGAWYIFGTKLILIQEFDDELLSVKEWKSHGEHNFMSYFASQSEPEWTKIQNMLRTSHQHLLSHANPV